MLHGRKWKEIGKNRKAKKAKQKTRLGWIVKGHVYDSKESDLWAVE